MMHPLLASNQDGSLARLLMEKAQQDPSQVSAFASGISAVLRPTMEIRSNRGSEAGILAYNATSVISFGTRRLRHHTSVHQLPATSSLPHKRRPCSRRCEHHVQMRFGTSEAQRRS